MSNHRILLLKTPEEDEIHIDGITFTNREFLEEIINTLQGINMYNGHDRDTKKILDYYFNIFSSELDIPKYFIIKYTDDLVDDDYILEYIQNRAEFVFIIDTDDIKYESLDDVCDELAMETYQHLVDTINHF